MNGMIFKSLSRKSESFTQLYDYINREGKPIGEGIVWNLSTFDVEDRSLILSDFYENAKFLSPRKNGNVLYHEILSLPRTSESDLDTLQNAIHDMAIYWLEARAHDHLAFGRIHLEDHNIHMHLMVSANGLGEDRKRLSKFEFERIQEDCEAYIAQRYPELDLPMLHQKTELPQPSPEEELKTTLQTILDQKITHETPSIKSRVHAAGLEFHYRGGTTYSVTFNGKRYRFKKLGLLDRLLEVIQTENAIASRQIELLRHLDRVTPLNHPEFDPDHETPPK